MCFFLYFMFAAMGLCLLSVLGKGKKVIYLCFCLLKKEKGEVECWERWKKIVFRCVSCSLEWDQV